MEHKAWLWRRKSSEKTSPINGKPDILLTLNEQENKIASELERTIEEKEQLASALAQSNAKIDLLTQRVKVAEEAIGEWEKAQTEAESIKKELAEALLQKTASEEKSIEKEEALNDASTTISRLQEEAQALQKKLDKSSNSLVQVATENSNLTAILEVKEKQIQDLILSEAQSEADFAALAERLDSSEKDNASLRYEVSMLLKELEIRKEDRDFHRKSADAAHKQSLESMKKISKLESECHRLRIMMRKRLPSPASVTKMKSEVQMLDNITVDRTVRRMSLEYGAMISKDFMSTSDYESFSKRVSSLVERLHAVEDENKIIKEALVKKNNELQSSRIILARTATKLSQAERELEEISKGRPSLELAKIEEDSNSCSESWASALISELEHFKNVKASTPSTTITGISEIGLMDDFIEMEKLAIVCVEKQPKNSNINLVEQKAQLSPKGINSELISSDPTSNEIDPVHPSVACSDTQTKTSKQSFQSDLEKPLCKMIELMEGIIQRSFTKNTDTQMILREDENSHQRKSISPSHRVGRVFIQEIPEACSVLQHLVVVCNDLLHGKADFKKFVYKLADATEWLIDHCFYSVEEFESKQKDETPRLTSPIRDVDEPEKDFERLRTTSSKESLSTQLKEASERISNLQAELVTLKYPNSCIEGQKLLTEDPGNQRVCANVELNQAQQVSSLLEVELEDKNNSCVELQTSESSAEVATPIHIEVQAGQQLRTDWEISAASEKLAECQATILSLGKQLKALAASKDVALNDNVLSPPLATRINHHPQLLPQMRDENETTPEHLKSPKTKEIICTEKYPASSVFSENNPVAGLLYGRTLTDNRLNKPSPVKSDAGKLVLVQKQPNGRASFLRKLLSRRKRDRKNYKHLHAGS